MATALLHGCPNVRLVATSREPLGVDGERQIMLAPLDVASASTLFLDRARAVQPHLDVDAVDDGQLTDLCRHLDGLPLAIELAAARTKTLPLPEISSRLQDRFQLLRRTGRAGISHHEGLRAAIDWSYELLFTDEQRTFRRLAVFAGGATISAAEAVCGPEAFETATRLVDRSLLIADTSGDRVRLGMLESIREYGREQLLAAGELDDARTAHLAWCVELAERVDVEVRRADQLEWLARLDREHDNMCAALAYGVERDPASALRLIGALSTPWWFRGRRPEMRHWTAVSLAAAPDVPSKDRARALAYQGFIAEPAVHPVPGQVEGELEAAEQRQRDAVTMGRALGDARVVASAQLRLMSTMTRRAAAGALLDRAEFAALADDTYGTYDLEGDHYGAGCTMVSAAIGALVTGDFDAAARATDSARRHAEASGERFVMSRVAYLDGVMADLAGDSAGRLSPRRTEPAPARRARSRIGHGAGATAGRARRPRRSAGVGGAVATLRRRPFGHLVPLRRQCVRHRPQPRRTARPRRGRPRSRRGLARNGVGLASRRRADRRARRSPPRASASSPASAVI